MLPRTLHVNKKLPSGPSFFKGADVSIIVDGIHVMAELEDFLMKLYNNEEEQRLVEEERESRRKIKEG